MTHSYDDDLSGWAMEQAFRLRSGEFSATDAVHIAEELDSISESCRRELEVRCSGLLAHLARWNRQEGFRCELRRRLIDIQRTRAKRLLQRVPSLAALIADALGHSSPAKQRAAAGR